MLASVVDSSMSRPARVSSLRPSALFPTYLSKRMYFTLLDSLGSNWSLNIVLVLRVIQIIVFQSNCTKKVSYSEMCYFLLSQTLGICNTHRIIEGWWVRVIYLLV